MTIFVENWRRCDALPLVLFLHFLKPRSVNTLFHHTISATLWHKNLEKCGSSIFQKFGKNRVLRLQRRNTGRWRVFVLKSARGLTLKTEMYLIQCSIYNSNEFFNYKNYDFRYKWFFLYYNYYFEYYCDINNIIITLLTQFYTLIIWHCFYTFNM